MTRDRALLTTILCTALAVPVAGDELPTAWKNWKYSMPMAAESPTEEILVRATLPLEVYGHSQSGLADLRIIDETGREVPFVLHARLGKEEREWMRAELTDQGFFPGKYTQLIVDAGPNNVLHNSLEISTGVDKFFAWVQIAASEDQESWGIVREEAPIYRFEDGDEGKTVISYPETRSRWIRLRILEGKRRFPVYGCRIAHEEIEGPELAALSVELEPDPQTPAGESVWQVDLGVANVPGASVVFEAGQLEFHRAVRVHVSTDEKTWRAVGRGDIYRYLASEASDDRERRSMRVRFKEARGRYWRVRVLNRNDAPIEGLQPTLEGTPRHLVFRREPDRNYRLVYGNSRASSPVYDLERLTPREDLEQAFAMSLGSEEVNSAYLSPEPWTERHPVIIWIALALTVAVAESKRSVGHRREGAQAMAQLQRQYPECFGAGAGAASPASTALAPVQEPSMARTTLYGLAGIAALTALGLWLLKRR